jgi:hypothetical protein
MAYPPWGIVTVHYGIVVVISKAIQIIAGFLLSVFEHSVNVSSIKAVFFLSVASFLLFNCLKIATIAPGWIELTDFGDLLRISTFFVLELHNKRLSTFAVLERWA